MGRTSLSKSGIQTTRAMRSRGESRWYGVLLFGSMLFGSFVLGSLGGCKSWFLPDTPQGFDSPDMNARVEAIVEAANEGEATAETIAGLVEQLESTDPAARLLAIRALERLTGETLGYDYTAPDWQRAEAVNRWADRVDAMRETEEAG